MDDDQITSQVLDLLGGPNRVRYIPETRTWMTTDDFVRWYPGHRRMCRITCTALKQANLDFMSMAARIAWAGPAETRQEAIDAVQTLRAFDADEKALRGVAKRVMRRLAEQPAVRADASLFRSHT